MFCENWEGRHKIKLIPRRQQGIPLQQATELAHTRN